MNGQKDTLRFIFITGTLSEIFYLIFLLYSTSHGDIPLYMFAYFETFLFMLITYFFLKKVTHNSTELNEERKIKKTPAILRFFAGILSIKEADAGSLKIPLIIIMTGIVFRISLFPSVETTSPDVNRYLWEGKVFYNGYNPYLVPPDDSRLEPLRDEIYEKVTFKNMTAIYPPFSELLFAGSYFLWGDSLAGLKLLYLIFDLLTTFFLLKLLYLKGKDLNNIILYSWMPLIIMEYYVNAHLDITGIFFMVLFLYLVEADKVISASIPFALAFVSKIFPVILFPLLFKKAGFKKTLRFSFNFILITTLFYIPFTYREIPAFTSLIAYMKKWQFNASLFYLLRHYISDGEMVRLICTGGFILFTGIISTLYKDFTKAAYGIFICLIIFSTTLYPWYLGWIAAINPFYNFYSVSSLLFTINFSNFTPLGSLWHEYEFVLLIEYIPFFLLLIYDIIITVIMRSGKRAVLKSSVDSSPGYISDEESGN